jgi:hypothetical protein
VGLTISTEAQLAALDGIMVAGIVTERFIAPPYLRSGLS